MNSSKECEVTFKYEHQDDKMLSIPKIPECFQQQQQKHHRDLEDKRKMNNKAKHQHQTPKRRQKEDCSPEDLEYKHFRLTSARHG